MTIADKTVLVTGANRGIGQALAEEALSRGAAGQGTHPGRGLIASGSGTATHAAVDVPPGGLLTALTTEHFVLQSMAATATGESASRASLYLMSLSASLVALGFAAQASRHAFALFAAAVLPVLFVLGCFTVERLIDTTITNITCLRRIARIRGYYVRLDAEARYYFPGTGLEADDSLTMTGVRPGRGLLWFTMATIIAVVNAAVAGSGTALALVAGAHLPPAAAAAAGILVAAGCSVGGIAYQRHRLRAVFPDWSSYPRA